MISWMFEHDYLDTCCFECLICMCLYFCICNCSAQLSTFHMERRSINTLIIIIIIIIASSSCSSDGNSSLLDEGGRTSKVPQATVELAGYGSVVWPDSLSEQLLEGAGLQQIFCCLTTSTARALLCMAGAEFRIQVMVGAVVACPKPEHYHLYPSGKK